jgi:hypothetical protein
MSKHVPIPVKPVKTRLGRVTVTEYKASCPKKGCKESRTMTTKAQAVAAIAGHVMAAHEDSSYC